MKGANVTEEEWDAFIEQARNHARRQKDRRKLVLDRAAFFLKAQGCEVVRDGGRLHVKGGNVPAEKWEAFIEQTARAALNADGEEV